MNITGDLHMNGAMASQYQYQPSMMPGEMNTLSPMYMDGQQMTNGHSMPGAQGMQRALPPGAVMTAATAGIGAVPHSRPCFEPESWRISPADRTSGLGIDARGLDVAAQRGAGWQVCETLVAFMYFRPG